MRQMRIVLDYAKLDRFTRELERLNGAILDKQFSEKVEVIASLPADQAVDLRRRFGIISD
jgi:putative IMPACT (imprinted ancient) family translation regulator